jgi:prepilin-type N-terminal cleavage/methylation domain-containing protein
MMELLCVIAIISILAALYLGAIAKAFLHVTGFLKGN